MPTEGETSKDLWTQILDFLTQIVAPSWNDLIALLPIAVAGLVTLGLLALARQWRRAGELNRPRIRRPVTGGTPPPGIHLPGPSRWPFVLPFGAMLLLGGLALAPRDDSGAVTMPFNLPLLGAGLLLLAVAVVGWLFDAMREWASTEHGVGHASSGTLLTSGAGGATAVLRHGGIAADGASRPARATTPPPGIHMPGPSPWPFFAPIGMMTLFIGLVFSPILLVGGLIMSVIAAVGWLREAGHEFRQTDAGHAPEPVTRDPEQAFPKRLVPVYLTIAAVTVLLTATPLIFSFLPGGGGAPGASPGGGEQPTDAPVVSASSAVSFEQTRVVVPADTPVTMTFENKQDGVPHNVAIFDSEARGTEHFNGELVNGPTSVEYEIPALPAGEYFFVCIVHPPMTGTYVTQ